MLWFSVNSLERVHKGSGEGAGNVVVRFHVEMYQNIYIMQNHRFFNVVIALQETSSVCLA